MLRTAGRAIGSCILLLAISSSHAYGQSGPRNEGGEYYEKVGSLNVWTTEDIYRRKFGYAPEFLTVRFGKHTGFDRVVFELKGDLIGYFVFLGRPPFESVNGTVKGVRGRAFVEIELYPVRSSDENIEANERVLAGQNRLRMPLIREVKQVEWFEGELRYVVGLHRATPFRVQVLSNPARLVVDFKR